MNKKLLSGIAIISSLFMLQTTNALAASSVNINDQRWLGTFKLDKDQLSKIKTSVEKALTSPIDSEQQCGTSRQDCVVRAAREWKVGNDTFREIVINIHNLGHASSAIGQNDGKWPSIVAK